MDSNAPIGVFDSGLGGLTVLKALRRLLPHENIIFVGDSARAPYGSRRPEEIILFLKQFIAYFKSRKVKMAVCACNTMTSYAYPVLKHTADFHLVPMNPAIEPAAAASPNKHIGVIATEATINKGMHKSAALAVDKNIKVYGLSCPKFVPLIESGNIDGPEMEEAVKYYADRFKDADIHSLILGCTHYPIISDVLAKYFGDKTALIDPAFETAKNAAAVLKSENLLNEQKKDGSLELRFSSRQKNTGDMARLILGDGVPPISDIDLTVFANKAE